MKSHGLEGEYCQTCAGLLDDVQRNYRRVIILDGQCAQTFQQSGDAARLDERMKADDSKIREESKHTAPGLPQYEAKKHAEELKESVHTKHGASGKRSHK